MSRSLIRSVVLASTAAALLCGTAAAWAQSQPDINLKRFGASQPLAGEYIVTLRPQGGNTPAAIAATAARLVQPLGGQVRLVYGNTLRGFSARLSDAAVQALRNHPLVEAIESDATVLINEAALTPAANQSGATWGLDRIDQRAMPLNGNYSYVYRAEGVYSFIIDTGLLASHREFAGASGQRVMPGYTAVQDGRGTSDCNGHGTHVAGTVGGTTFGVAKSTTLVPVRVLDCNGSGSLSNVIAGIDWVGGQSGLRPAVANLSLGSSRSTAVNQAVAGLVNRGVTVVVAGGNNNADACSYSPASEPSAITVGATTNADARASYSNYGVCLDLFAPGSNITSAWYTSTTATQVLSGTSMASPHVAGMAALVLAARPGATPTEVARTVIGSATGGLVTSAGTGSPNRLLYTLDSSPVPSGPTMAVRAISGSASNTTLTWRANARVTVATVTATGFGSTLAGVTIQGSFNPGGAASCITDGSGSCTLSSASILTTTPSTTFSVSQLDSPNATYDPGRNAVSSIVINR